VYHRNCVSRGYYRTLKNLHAISGERYLSAVHATTAGRQASVCSDADAAARLIHGARRRDRHDQPIAAGSSLAAGC